MLKAQLKKRVVIIDMKTSFININVCPGKKFGDLVMLTDVKLLKCFNTEERLVNF
jgi:hypothetical protein